MTEIRRVDVAHAIDQAPLKPLQIVVTVISALIIMIDGYDTLCVGFVAPALALELDRPIEGFALVFSSGLLGLVIGSIAISPIADHIGRRKVLVAALLLMGTFSIAPVLDLHFERLILYRFLTGLGLGSAMPCVIAITSEYAPQRYKALLTNLMFIGFPVGGVLGGILASKLMGQFGWESVFLLGGIPALFMIPVVLVALPESIIFLAARANRSAEVAHLLSQLSQTEKYTAADDFFLRQSEAGSGRVHDLFASGRWAGTLLIWTVMFCTLLVLFNLTSWLPALMQLVGSTPEQSVYGPVMMLAGGVCGGVLFGIIVDRIGAPFFLAWTYLMGAISMALIGLALQSYIFTLLIIFLTGMCINGNQLTMNGFCARFYPSKIRSTGVGWALGIGRLGAVVGPVIGGAMLAARWNMGLMFAVVGGASIVAAGCMLTLGLISRAHSHRSIKPSIAGTGKTI